MLLQKLIAWLLVLRLFFAAGFFLPGNRQNADAIAKDETAAAGYALTQILLEKCYDPLRHNMHKHTDDKGLTYAWGAASFLEAMADAYRLFPADLRLRYDYADALKRCMPHYLAKDQTIETPSGPVSDITYYNASAGNRGDYYYDDNAWICIQLLFGYRNLGDASLLEAAKQNLAFLWTGWDDVLGGGIYWSASYESKNACANAPTAIAHLLYYQITGEEAYLERGKAIYDWMNAALRENDLFSDAIAVSDGGINHWKAAYNQATMIYAGSLLYEITGDAQYYDLTKKTVDASLPLMFIETETEDGGTDITMRENPIYSAWCVGWLVRSYVKFFEVDPQKDTAAMDRTNAVLQKELATKDEDGLYDPFFCSGGVNPEAYTSLLAQSGVACTLLNAAYYNAVLQ